MLQTNLRSINFSAQEEYLLRERRKVVMTIAAAWLEFLQKCNETPRKYSSGIYDKDQVISIARILFVSDEYRFRQS